jgi:prepilin-type N-terminal cleavage/methylation domain-containing protein
MKSNRSSAFTLIELLVVVAIIAILVALLVPAVGKARQAAAKAKARAAVVDIQTAFSGYYDEYKKWPTGLTAYDNGKNVEFNATGIQMESDVMEMLKGANINKMNPRRVPFLEPQEAELNELGQYVDPWGNPYKYMLDYNLDDKVHIWFSNNNGETNLSRTVAVWSCGRDGSDEEGPAQKDDIRSW